MAIVGRGTVVAATPPSSGLMPTYHPPVVLDRVHDRAERAVVVRRDRLAVHHDLALAAGRGLGVGPGELGVLEERFDLDAPVARPAGGSGVRLDGARRAAALAGQALEIK